MFVAEIRRRAADDARYLLPVVPTVKHLIRGKGPPGVDGPVKGVRQFKRARPVKPKD
jgi:hypothetical protein